MKKRHQLKLVGITYNQIESGVYAVILEEVNGKRRIPIVIGYPEAQAIECHLQKVRTPRPLTHDLIKTLIDTFNLKLICIDIRKLPTGVFAADLVMEGPNGELHKIDTRSSDALAIAIRTGSPIYTSAEVLEESGILPKNQNSQEKDSDAEQDAEEFLKAKLDSIANPIESFRNIEEFISSNELAEEDADTEILEFLSNYSDKEIETQISQFASEEKYEVAARLKSLLKKRRENQ